MEEIIKFLTPRISKEGYTIIFLAGVFAVLGLMFFDKIGLVFIVLFLFCIYFFRDPERVTPMDENLVISPADGVVSKIDRNISYPFELNGQNKIGTRVSIFLNVFNVHVNRVPATGIIVKESYRAGKFINASLDKASEDNERQSVLMTTTKGHEIAFVQIAGLIARRIVCKLKEGDNVNAGARYGIIKFGSRLDVYLPEGIEPSVIVGQTMIGGESIIAKLDGNQKEITGRTE